MGGKLPLFDDQDEPEDPNFAEINIDKDFAKRFEHNNKREDLHRLQELKKKGVIDESDKEDDDDSEEDDDDEVDGIVTKSKKKELAKFIDALNKIKKQDPSLKDKEAKLFDSESDDDDEGEGDDNEKGSKKSRKKHLKDVTAQLLIEEGADFVDELEREYGVGVKSHSQELEERKNEFLRSMAEEDESGEDGELFKVKEVKGNDEEEDEYEEDIAEKLNDYFDVDEKLDEKEMFLKDYFRKRLWERKEDRVGGDGEEVEFSEDEEEIERQEDYERGFNFRFEENTGDRILGHARTVDGSVRKKTNTNKLQRDRKKERMEQADLERKEELKRLKNLKKKEINEKLQKIRDTAGIAGDGDIPLELDDLDAEFDPEEHDRKMKQAFGENYYEAEDMDPKFGSDDEELGDDLTKPDFDKEDELLGLPKGWDDENKTRDSFLSARERILKQKAELEGNSEYAEADENAIEQVGKRKKKRKASDVEKAIREQLMEEYYKLDYEDTIGDLKTRFKYKPVKAKRFGLKTEEILMMDDKELNQFVSLKKLATYTEEDWVVKQTLVQATKKKIQESLQGEPSDVTNKKRKRDNNQEAATVTSTDKQVQKTETSTVDESLSRKSKRKQRNKELKPSESRLMAYGIPTSKPKNKK